MVRAEIACNADAAGKFAFSEAWRDVCAPSTPTPRALRSVGGEPADRPLPPRAPPAVRNGGRALRGEAGGGGGSGSRRGFRAAQPVPGKPHDSEAVDTIVQRRQGRSPATKNVICVVVGRLGRLAILPKGGRCAVWEMP